MDNKITKKRLEAIFSYDWIKIVLIFILVVLIWEMLFAFTSVRISVGQRFNYYYDIGVSGKNDDKLRVLMYEKKGISEVSVITVDYEDIVENNDLLETRLKVKDGDIIFSNLKADEKGWVRAKAIIDTKYVYDFESLLSDAQKYVASFKDADGKLSNEKIKQNFYSRVKGDRRYRTEQQKKDGLVAEIARIENLEKEIEAFKVILANESILFKYRYMENTYNFAHESDKAMIESIYNESKELTYGINLGNLKCGEGDEEISKYVTLYGNADARDVVLMAFNYLAYQKDEQFEVITFITTLVRNCSDIL